MAVDRKNYDNVWHKKNRCRVLEYERAHNKKHPTAVMLKRSRTRARQKQLEFSLIKEDLVIPLRCPILNIELCTTNQKQEDNSPSIDRIDNEKGYTKDNILIISNRANSLKKDATLEEMKLIYEFYKDLVK